MNKNSIKLQGYMIKNFILEKQDNIPKEKEGSVNINWNVYKNNKDNSYKLSMNIITYTNKTMLNLTMEGFFLVPSNISKEIKETFFNTSALAILYPYMRTFISNVTSFDIDDTVILPIINFNDKSLLNQQ